MNKFTEEEVGFVHNVFSQACKVDATAPNALEVVERVQSILRKMNELKEQSNGDSEL